MKLDEILGRLPGRLSGPNSSGYYCARCPVCGNALSVKGLDGGSIYFRCWGETHRCSRDNILAALNGQPLRPVTPGGAPRNVIQYIMKIWDESAQDALLTQYLCSRNITIKTPGVLRVHPALRHSPSGTTPPAMVAMVQAPNGQLAIHRTWLHVGATVGKAEVEPNKMALGPLTGGAVRLVMVAAKLAIAEGIESALSFTQLTGIPCWAGLGGNLSGIVLPPEVREVYLALDGDAAGDAYAHNLGPRLAREGRKVRLAQAPRGQDWNDLLRGGDGHGEGG